MLQAPIYNKKQNYHLVLNYCKHNLKENYSRIFQFYTLDEDKCSLFSQRGA